MKGASVNRGANLAQPCPKDHENCRRRVAGSGKLAADNFHDIELN
jgi:hypothetical protein